MKFKIDIEMKPEELRKVLGLPDVEGFHEDMMNRIREQMEAGVEGYDPLTLFKPYLSSGLGSMDALQKIMLSMMTNPYGGGKSSE
ncbi:hypothetical protein IOQ59_02890 [Pontibacterium sp. N1Y112]|jgi:hypothetical protein|uniref:Uncharacterized protein n=1 Tax=Pontibacterium sinense TaxID=2781979 RepID=A0A8J7FAS4_9GAMM|nr:DUF6489 family protein [Pontibacterium sinense]MBE9396204.1 hypothetical protein [Pontibacterium sinense]